MATEPMTHLVKAENTGTRGKRRYQPGTGDCGKLGITTSDPDQVTCGLCLLRIYTGTVRPYWRGKLAGRKVMTWRDNLNKNINLRG